jgi:hypothetical protein
MVMDVCGAAVAVEVDANPRLHIWQHGDKQSRGKHAQDH